MFESIKQHLKSHSILALSVVTEVSISDHGKKKQKKKNMFASEILKLTLKLSAIHFFLNSCKQVAAKQRVK